MFRRTTLDGLLEIKREISMDLRQNLVSITMVIKSHSRGSVDDVRVVEFFDVDIAGNPRNNFGRTAGSILVWNDLSDQQDAGFALVQRTQLEQFPFEPVLDVDIDGWNIVKCCLQASVDTPALGTDGTITIRVPIGTLAAGDEKKPGLWLRRH